MFVLPYRKLEIHSPHRVDGAMALLKNVVEPKKWLRVGSGGALFEGTITDASFEIQRIISYRNSFLPQLRGSIAAEGEGSRVSVTMQLHPVVMVFMIIWLSGVLFAAIAFIPAAVSDRANLGLALIPLGMLLFGVILTLGAFTFEAKKAERLLLDIFDGVPRALDGTGRA